MAKLSSFGKSLGGGYSAQLAKDLVGNADLLVVGDGLVPRYAWSDDDNRYTSDVTSTSLSVSAEGFEPFEVKLPSDADFTGSFLSHVSFDALEACQVRGSVYFRARAVKVVE